MKAIVLFLAATIQAPSALAAWATAVRHNIIYAAGGYISGHGWLWRGWPTWDWWHDIR